MYPKNKMPKASSFYGFGKMRVENKREELTFAEEIRKVVYCGCKTKTKVGTLGLRYCPNDKCFMNTSKNRYR